MKRKNILKQSIKLVRFDISFTGLEIYYCLDGKELCLLANIEQCLVLLEKVGFIQGFNEVQVNIKTEVYTGVEFDGWISQHAFFLHAYLDRNTALDIIVEHELSKEKGFIFYSIPHFTEMEYLEFIAHSVSPCPELN